MAAIARHLGVAKPTLYRMAGSREELIALTIDAEAERLLEAIHHHGAPGLFRFVEERPAGFLLLFGGRYPHARQAVRRVEHRVKAPAPAAAAFIAGAAAIALLTLESGGRATAERLRSDFDDAAKLLPRISDPASVEAPAGRA